MIQNRRTKLNVSIDGIIAVLIALGFYSKEFYLLPSGSLQIGDIFLLLAFGFCLISGRVFLEKIDYPLVLFLILSISVNFIYYICFDDSSFLKYSLYTLFSVVIVLLFRIVMYDEKVAEYSLIALKLAVITQVILSILRGGRYFFGRYSGTFNDPNQFGYYVLMCMFMIYVIQHINKKRMSLVWLVLPGYLILLSQSSGMLVGYTVFLAFFIWRITGDSSKTVQSFSRALVLIFLLGSLLVLFTVNDLSRFEVLNNSRISGLRRIIARLSRVASIRGFFDSFVRDRSLSRIFENPAGFLYGTGEGMWARYSDGNEIHSSMISLCFYYGIIPYSLWVFWIKSNLQNLNSVLLCVYIAHIVEAFTLANHRQPFFWILFVLASHELAKTEANEEPLDVQTYC